MLTSPEELVYHEIFELPDSPTKQDIMPDILKPLIKEIRKHKSQSSAFSPSLIPMPVFIKQAIDELPSVHITVPLKPNEFDWSEFLSYLAIDLGVDKNDMFLMSVEEGSTIYEIKLKAAISLSPQKMEKIAEKIGLIVLPTSKSAGFIAQQKLSRDIKEIPKIEAKLSNFSENQASLTSENLTLDDINAALELMQRPTIIDPHVWEYLRQKSRKISNAILHAFQRSPNEYVIESMLLVQNEELYDKYSKCAVHGEEVVLFHGTKTTNFDGIFDTNFKNLHTTDAGWYGQGIYFSSSPQYCTSYAESSESGIMYFICSLVKLGNVYAVKDTSFHGKPMRADSNTHYVKVDVKGHPTNAHSSFFEEFVIKESNQILPLYIVGLRGVHRFVVWRDAKITDRVNGALFTQMKERYKFNIYGSETSVDALTILKCKLDDSNMQCVVATNGDDKGEDFVRECQKLRPSLPIIVYDMNVDYHRQWAAAISSASTSQIEVTDNSNDVFRFISTTFSGERKPKSSVQQLPITKPINAFDTAPSDIQQRLRNPPENIQTIHTPKPDSPPGNAPQMQSGNPALINFPQTNGNSVRPGQPLLCAAEGPSQNVTFAVMGQQSGQGAIEPVVPNPFDISSYGTYQVTIFDGTQQQMLISTLITVIPELKICVPKKFVIKDSLNNIVVGGRVNLKRENGTVVFTSTTDSTGNAHIRRGNEVRTYC